MHASSRSFLQFSRSIFIVAVLVCICWIVAEAASFHNAPASAATEKDPYSGSPSASAAGKKLYAQNCAQCHGNNLQGMGPAPSLDSAALKAAKPGEVFWFITTGNVANGMPSWSMLPKQQRWQIVTFLESHLHSEAK